MRIFAEIHYGRAFAGIMNRCGYDYVTLGNHDFNYGMPYLDTYLDALRNWLAHLNRPMSRISRLR